MTLDFCVDTQCQTIGQACDDGDPCTTGETYNSTCSCIGGLVSGDSDNDGVCDVSDICPNVDDNLIGEACDDGDPCTSGETYNSNCACSGGVFTDSDNDGTCDGYDICPDLNDGLIGMACEDGDICTEGETYDINCNCSGGTFTDTDNNGICDGEEDCIDHDIVEDNRVINSDVIVSDFIQNNGRIQISSNVKYKAGNYVELTNDFEVEQNTNFEIMIEECTP